MRKPAPPNLASPAKHEARIRVDSEWATLREVVVGIPFYRIPKPYPAQREAGAPEALWRKVKAREGQTMEEAMPSDYRRCAAQMDGVVRLLQGAGVRVHRTPAFARGEEEYLSAAHPESIQFFPRDPLLVAGSRIVELCQRDGRRRRERAPLRRLLRQRGVAPGAMRSMPFPSPAESEADPFAFAEGGDCLVMGDQILAGVRAGGTSDEGVAWLQAALGNSHRVTPVPLSTDFAHLDLALGLVRPGLGVVCREGLPEGLPASVRHWEWVELSRDEAHEEMAANLLPLGPSRVLLPERAGRVADELRRRGMDVVAVPFDTVTAFGGGLRCWSQPLARWD
jgi:glycine amidinotransferase